MMPSSRFSQASTSLAITAVHRHSLSDRRSSAMAASPPDEFSSNSPEILRQKNLIQQCLDRDLVEGEFWYVVVAEWLEQLKRYLGIPSTRKFYHQRTHPGPIVTRRDYAHTVDVVHEDAWKMLVKLYTVSEGHKPMKLVVYSYARAPEIEHNLNSFKVMVCNAPIEDFHNVRFSKMEKVGHVEWQIRDLYHIDNSKVTRLWAKPDVDSDWRTLFNRDLPVGKALGIESDFTRSIVAMEICDSDGLWSNSPDDTDTTQDNPIGQIGRSDIFQDVTTTWEADIFEQIEGVGRTLVSRLHDSFSSFVDKAKDYISDREIRVRDRERDVSNRESRLESLKLRLKDKEETLDAEIEICRNRIEDFDRRKIEQEGEYVAKKNEMETTIKERLEEVNKERYHFDEARRNFQTEMEVSDFFYLIVLAPVSNISVIIIFPR